MTDQKGCEYEWSWNQQDKPMTPDPRELAIEIRRSCTGAIDPATALSWARALDTLAAHLEAQTKVHASQAVIAPHALQAVTDEAETLRQQLEAQAAEVEAWREKGVHIEHARRLAARAEAAEAEVSGLRAARMAYASEFPLNEDGEPDVGSVHANIRALKAENERLREAAQALRQSYHALEGLFVEHSTNGNIDDTSSWGWAMCDAFAKANADAIAIDALLNPPVDPATFNAEGE
jgi:hypothetical protein